jgi:signal transduction histidine kinase
MSPHERPTERCPLNSKTTIPNAAATGHWSIAGYFLALAGVACVLSTGQCLLAPRSIHENLWGATAAGAALLAVLCAAAFWCGGRFKQPLRNLRDAAGEVAQGHLEARVPLCSGSPRELSQLSANFNGMVERLQQAETELHAANLLLEDRVAARTAELVNANKALEAFAYSVSHDLRAPVRLIQGFSSLLQRESCHLSPGGQQHLQTIRCEARHMNDMIDAMLEMSRLAAVPLVQTPVDLSLLAREIGEALRHSDPDRHVEFLIQPGLRTVGDQRLLRSLFQNLLGNSWKFTRRQPHPKIEFGATQRDGQAVFFIRDNGAGFHMAGASRLFSPFQRLHTADEFEGLGIGLATVRRILDRHGGQVWAESETGDGATFYFTLHKSA